MKMANTNLRTYLSLSAIQIALQIAMLIACASLLSSCNQASEKPAPSLSQTSEPLKESTNKVSEQPAEPSAPVSLPLEKLVPSDVPKEIVIPGQVSALPDHSLKVSPAIAGKIVKITVVPGQRVKKGQLLAQLDNRHTLELLDQANAQVLNAKAGLSQAQDNLTFAKDNLDRQDKLFQAEVSAKKDVVLARNQVQTATTQVQAAQAQLKSVESSSKQIETELTYSQVRSPIDGLVANRFLNVGESSDPNIPIVQIVGLDTVIVNASLPADSPEDIHANDTAQVRTIAHGDVTYTAIVIAVSPVVDPQTNTIRIQLRCPNRDGQLREGQTVNVTIVSKIDHSSLLVPKTALVPDPQNPDKKMVYVVQSGKAKRVAVTIGSAKGDRVEVSQGLKSGDIIVSEGAYGLPDDASVEAKTSP